MINGNINNSPVRQVKGKVELFEGSTLLNTFTYRDRLKSFTVERVGESSKFFGFGICQKLNVKLIDKDRELEISTAHTFRAYLTTGEEYYTPFPTFYVTEVHRDENTNELSITAYDALYWSSEDKVLSNYVLAYHLTDFLFYCLPRKISSIDDGLIPEEVRYIAFPEGSNLEGTETCKEVLDDIAEAYQAIYYLDNSDTITFKRLDRDGAAVLTIGKADYIKLDSKTNRRLATIYHSTQLGDDEDESLTIQGTTQYVRDNVFWEKIEDIKTVVVNALAAIGGITINQFECSWRGNYLLEPGDKIDMITKDNDVVTGYILNDSIEYDGSLSQKTSWSYEDNASETPSNPGTVGEGVRKTYAKVDRANKTITQVVSDVAANAENISSLQLTTEDITAQVKSVEEATTDAIDQINGHLDTLEQSVNLKLTDEDVTIKITEALTNGVDRVETSTGFKFDDTGLTVEKIDENGERIGETATQITENGMIVYDANNDAVLTANNIGVDARNLHATTYLIIGNNSRFEDFGSDRTGCFWIGG